MTLMQAGSRSLETTVPWAAAKLAVSSSQTTDFAHFNGAKNTIMTDIGGRVSFKLSRCPMSHTLKKSNRRGLNWNQPARGRSALHMEFVATHKMLPYATAVPT
jgi:hypothetical protein